MPSSPNEAEVLLQRREGLRLGLRLLVFLRCCLFGRGYPPGEAHLVCECDTFSLPPSSFGAARLCCTARTSGSRHRCLPAPAGLERASAEERQRGKAQALALLLHGSCESGAPPAVLLHARSGQREAVLPSAAVHSGEWEPGPHQLLGLTIQPRSPLFVRAVLDCWRLWGEMAHSEDTAALQRLPASLQVRNATPSLLPLHSGVHCLS